VPALIKKVVKETRYHGEKCADKNWAGVCGARTLGAASSIIAEQQIPSTSVWYNYKAVLSFIYLDL
jgi:hypothetical protein